MQRHVALARMDFDDERLVELGGELIALGMLLDRGWLDAIAWPSLVGTCWANRAADNGRSAIILRPAGMLEYRLEDSRAPGSWVQVGNAVRLRINDYSTHAGVVIGTRMRGLAENDDEQEWSWGLLPYPAESFDGELPDLPPEPRCTNPIRRRGE